MSFPFEKLDVYNRSLLLIEKIDGISKLVRGAVSYSVIDQMTRAALSVPLNIAESSGRWNVKEKKQFLRVSRGSVFEIIPVVQILYRKGLLKKTQYESIYGDLEILSKMLSNLIISLDRLNSQGTHSEP